MKKNIRLLFGFTIAELLVTMLISALVAAAMVPVIGLKKIKFPRTKYAHGVAECYYEPDSIDDNTGNPTGWHLMYYYADNGTRKDAVAAPIDGDSCTFQAPNADYYEIIVIGAGTDAGANPETGQDDVPTFVSAEDSLQHGYIAVDGTYQTTINNAQIKDWNDHPIQIGNQLRYVIDRWVNAEGRSPDERRIVYNLVSPIGSSGTSDCHYYPLNHSGVCAAKPECTTNAALCPGPLERGGDQGWDSASINIATAQADSSHCWIFLHGRGGNSGTGKETRVALGSDAGANGFYFTSKTRIETKANNQETFVSFTDDNGLPHKLTLKSSIDGYSPYIIGMSMYSEEPASFLPLANPSQKTECKQENLAGTWCNSRVIKNDSLVNVAPLAAQNRAKRTCSTTISSPTKGVIYYSSDKNEDFSSNTVHEPDQPLGANRIRWDYSGISGTGTIASGGNFGQERSIIYENLKGQLTLVPARYLGRNATPEERRANVTFVRQNPNDPATTIISASSAIDDGTESEVRFLLNAGDIPMPSVPLERAKPRNRQHFNYVSKLTTLGFDGGLINCDRDNTCPGYAGIGTYFYLSEIPDVNRLKITNLYNGRDFGVPVNQIAREQHGVKIDDGFCDDGRTYPREMDVVEYMGIDNDENPDADLGQKNFRPSYCREPKSQGSPGAVIIVW